MILKIIAKTKFLRIMFQGGDLLGGSLRAKPSRKESIMFDIAIIGSGPAALSAAVNAKQRNKSVCV